MGIRKGERAERADRNETQRSGLVPERRRDGASELSRLRGSERYEVRADEVKLERAQGECLGIRN